MKKLYEKLKSKSGMTLVEVLTAMTILTLLMFCFMPLFLGYFGTVNQAGTQMKTEHKNAGIMHRILGNSDKDGLTGYTYPVGEVPLTLTAPDATVTRDGITAPIPGVTLGVNNQLDPFTGYYVSSKPNDPLNGLTTVMSTGGSDIKCFPTTITDDFVEAHIMLVANGFTFVDGNFNSDQYQLYYTNEQGKHDSSTRLKYGDDYKIERYDDPSVSLGEEDYGILILTVYGGGKVSFETSPIIFKYGGVEKKIEVDAPQMIMVGEPDKQGDYYYYVSRGELDKDGNLIMLRRKMEGIDKNPKASPNSRIDLNATMNDVEWVPADSGDGFNVDSEGNKYGYYAMCGNDGQIRRFWKDPVTGNYYWGGDNTFYTDTYYDKVEHDKDSSKPYHMYSVDKNGNPTGALSSDENDDGRQNMQYGTDASYKFCVRRGHTNEGFVMGKFKYGLASFPLMSANTWSVTAFNGEGAKSTFYYASDGKMYGFNTAKSFNGPYPTWKEARDLPISGHLLSDSEPEGGKNMMNKETGGVNQEALTWLKTDKDNEDAYYNLTGDDRTKNPITLTCVDSIVLSGPKNKRAEDVYEGNVQHGSYELMSSSGNIWDVKGHGGKTNLSYPKNTYTLYCGYIPGAMDAWTERTGFHKANDITQDQKFANLFTADSGYWSREMNDVQSNLDRPEGDRKLYSGNDYPRWKGNFGITPVITGPIISENLQGQKAYWANIRGWTKKNDYIFYYPYSNFNYAVTGKFYDKHTSQDTINSLFNLGKGGGMASTSADEMPYRVYNAMYNKQQYMTNGDVVDITLSYFSHPLAVHLGMNPTDDLAYDMANDKGGNDVLYWSNRRETVTYLDCASTFIPQGDRDVPVSLMVGYTMGGLVEYSGDDAFINTVMNNGIVSLRAGEAYIERVGGNLGDWVGSETNEYCAKDKTGYKLDTESNYFHQFYYLNSRTQMSNDIGIRNKDIGDIYGADYWQNNRHIDYVSMYGGKPDTPENDNADSYEYLRCHPMSNTQVYCVAWGQTWNNNPEAMWGTENGTLLSWYVDLQDAKKDSALNPNDGLNKWGDRNVDAEFQSYKWIDNVDGHGNGKKFKVNTDRFAETVGANGATFSVSAPEYREFFDKGSRELDNLKNGGSPIMMQQVGFISVLDCVADIGYYNEHWVAVGDQSGKDPADYCANGSVMLDTSTDSNAKEKHQAYTGNGRGGSWVNVRYWVDYDGTNDHNNGNDCHLWKAVQVSEKANYNFIQISVLNGMWIATGYEDKNGNNEWDSGEQAKVCWTRDPMKPCTEEGGWTDAAVFLEAQGNGEFKDVSEAVGGINSCATRS